MIRKSVDYTINETEDRRPKNEERGGEGERARQGATRRSSEVAEGGERNKTEDQRKRL